MENIYLHIFYIFNWKTGGEKIMIDLKKIDEIYIASESGTNFSIRRKMEGDLELVFDGDIPVSEAFEINKNRKDSEKKAFMADVYTFEDSFVVRKLNDELKICTDDIDNLLYSSLDHFIIKSLITYPKDFIFCRKDTTPEYVLSFVNQVLFLEPEKSEYKENVEFTRKQLYYLLKYGDPNHIDLLIGNQELEGK